MTKCVIAILGIVVAVLVLAVIVTRSPEPLDAAIGAPTSAPQRIGSAADDGSVPELTWPAEATTDRRASRVEHTIRFPDGESKTIRLRRRPTPVTISGEASLDLNLVEAYEILTGAAAGQDANAAFRMWELRRFCDGFLGDEASLKMAVDTIYQQQMYAEPWGLTLTGEGSGQRIVDMADAAHRHFDQCREVASRDTGQPVDWLTNAAELGDSDALKHLGRMLGRTDAAVQAFEEAWQHGEIYANAWLSHLYSNGFEDDNGQIIQDATQAFAHQYLFAALLEAKYAGRGARENPFARRAWGKVASMQAGLRPHELQDAHEIAKALLHEACCLR